MLEFFDTDASLNMDERFLKHLKEKAKVNRDEVVQGTHKEITSDLHTSRVAFFGLLKALEIKEEVKLHQN